jgi:hypothetical protein
MAARIVEQPPLRSRVDQQYPSAAHGIRESDEPLACPSLIEMAQKSLGDVEVAVRRSPRVQEIP